MAHKVQNRATIKPWHVGVAALAVGAVGAILLASSTASAAPAKPKPVPPPPPQPKCPDGSLAPNGDVTKCPLLGQNLGQNDPTSPPGGWSYNGNVQSDVVTKAQALAAVDPCAKQNEQIVRDFQGAAGLAQINGGPGWDQVSPPGTDGRYGGDDQKALAAILGVSISQVPQTCFANGRPGWWGAVGTYTNP